MLILSIAKQRYLKCKKSIDYIKFLLYNKNIINNKGITKMKTFKQFLKESYQTERNSYKFKAILNGKNINGSVSVWKDKKTNNYSIESDDINYSDNGFKTEKDALDYFVEFLNDGDYDVRIDKKPYKTESIYI